MSGSYVATAGQTVFAANFPLFIDAEGNPAGIHVSRRRAGVETILGWPADLSISGGPPYPSGPPSIESFNVTLAAPCLAGDVVIVFSLLPALRDRANAPGGATRTPTLEGDAMYFAAQAQEAQRDLFRTVIAPLGEGGVELPLQAIRAGKFLAFDGNGDPIAVPPITLPTSNGALNQLPTGQFFSDLGAVVNRINDRLFVGAAAVNDGAYPNVSQDWLTQYQRSIGFSDGSIVSTTAAILGGDDPQIGYALITGARSLHATNAGTACIAFASFALNNSPTIHTKAWGGYFDVKRTSAAAAETYGLEIDIASLTPTIAPTPYQQGDVVALQLGSGGELPATGQQDTSTAIGMYPNGSRFQRGIVFGSGSISSDVAIEMPKDYQIRWLNAAGHVGGSISSSATGALAGNINFTDGGVQISGADGSAVAYFNPLAGGANWITIGGATTGTSPFVAAQGSDTNVDLALVTKGTGRLVGFADLIWEPAAANSLTINGQFSVEVQSNAAVKLAYRGTDGVVRKSASIALA